MKIIIKELKIDAIIGILAFERTAYQEVIIDLETTYEYKRGSFVDYSHIVELITTNIIEGEYELIEDALLCLGSLLHEKFPTIKTLNIEIKKPNIISNCIVSASEYWEF